MNSNLALAKIQAESLARLRRRRRPTHNSLLRDNGRSGVNSAEFNYETPWEGERANGRGASDITGGWYSLKSLLVPRCERGKTGRMEGRLLTPSGEIEYGANFTRDTAIDSLPRFHSFSRFALSPRHSSFRTDKRMPFFPVVSANRGIGNPSDGYSVSRACLFFPSLTFVAFISIRLCLFTVHLRILFLLLAPLS